MSLIDVSQKISTLMKERQPLTVEGISPDLHPLPPFLSKRAWSELGDALRSTEQPRTTHIPGEKWISLRCDGTGFSKLTKRLKRDGVLRDGGYSPELADLMKACCRELMIKFSARCGYTQSDELTVLLSPASVIREVQQPHLYGGRVQKLCSLVAATVTSRFQYELMALCMQKQLDPSTVLHDNLPTFDCRVGVYDTDEEALSLILWRAYDCGINAVSDAVYKSAIPGCKQVLKQGTEQKLLWLMEQNLLPLAPHQREGTFFVKRRRLEQGMNRKSQEYVTYLRGRIDKVDGNVLQLYKDGNLFPNDDVLPV